MCTAYLLIVTLLISLVISDRDSCVVRHVHRTLLVIIVVVVIVRNNATTLNCTADVLILVLRIALPTEGESVLCGRRQFDVIVHSCRDGIVQSAKLCRARTTATRPSEARG